MKTFTESLREAIASAGYTREKAAKKLEISLSTLNKWLTKGKQSTTPHVLTREGALARLGVCKAGERVTAAKEEMERIRGQAARIEEAARELQEIIREAEEG